MISPKKVDRKLQSFQMLVNKLTWNKSVKASHFQRTFFIIIKILQDEIKNKELDYLNESAQYENTNSKTLVFDESTSSKSSCMF